MSVVFPCRKRDFLAPSKALQELKQKLGPVYFDAKLIECPQNAVELGKLLQKWDELDKQKFRKLSETSREQRILQNSLSSRHVKEPSAVSLLSRGSSSTKSFVDITKRHTPPPGFRFHANGDPKSDGLDTLTDCDPDSRTSILSRTSTLESNTSTIADGEFGYGRSFDDNYRDDPTLTAASKPKDQEFEEIDYSKEIEDLETIILQLEAVLVKSDGPSTSNEEDLPKRTFLRAHSNSDDVLESSLHRPSANYAYDPEEKKQRDLRPKKPMFGPGFNSVMKRSSKCRACQFKLKHVGNEFAKPIAKSRDVLKERWNIAPSGCFLSSPDISAASAVSLTGLRRSSKQSLHSDKSKPTVSFDNSKSVLSRDMSKPAMSPDNSEAVLSRGKSKPAMSPDNSEAVLSRGKSTPLLTRNYSKPAVGCDKSKPALTKDHSKSVLNRGTSAPDFSDPLGCKSSKTSARHSAEQVHSLTSSRVSSKDLAEGVSSATLKTSSHRFLSPQQRESRMQVLRSQAEQENLKCQEKVDAFLGKLEKRKSSTTSRQRWQN